MSSRNSPEYILGYIRDRLTIAVLDGIWHDQQFEYSGSNMIYRGVHEMHNIGDTDPDWEVWKYTWDASNNLTRIEGPIHGKWSDRLTMDWA
jgi:YD repeat-containing protein